MGFRNLSYYMRNVVRDVVPPIIFQRRLEGVLHRIDEYDATEISDRVTYYNRLTDIAEIGDEARKISEISMSRSFYYYDLKEHARFFPRSLRLRYEFGDVTSVPPRPTIVKSRPIRGPNADAVIMKLEKLRHFNFPADETAFEDKKPIAVWRGSDHNPKRVTLVRRLRGHPLCDVGFTNVAPTDDEYGEFLPPAAQMAYRYVISIEGIDVATNLKWILASNSLCIMPEPNYETWFMEGRLRAGEHYVRVADDFEDLEEKIRYFESHPSRAREIIRNANRHARVFRDERREQLVSLLVLYKYFAATGQIEPDGRVAELIWPERVPLPMRPPPC